MSEAGIDDDLQTSSLLCQRSQETERCDILVPLSQHWHTSTEPMSVSEGNSAVHDCKTSQLNQSEDIATESKHFHKYEWLDLSDVQTNKTYSALIVPNEQRSQPPEKHVKHPQTRCSKLNLIHHTSIYSLWKFWTNSSVFACPSIYIPSGGWPHHCKISSSNLSTNGKASVWRSNECDSQKKFLSTNASEYFCQLPQSPRFFHDSIKGSYMRTGKWSWLGMSIAFPGEKI